MATETDQIQSQWLTEQLEIAQKLAANANSALRVNQLAPAAFILAETQAVLDMIEDQELDAVNELRAQILNEMGFLAQRQGNLEKAHESHEQAVIISEKLLANGVAFRTNAAATLINFAGVLAQQEKFDESREKINRACELISSYLDENPEGEDAYHMGFGAYHTRAMIEIASELLDEAHDSARKSHTYAEKTFEDNIERTIQSANAFQQLAIQFFQKKQLDYAITWAKQSEEIARQAFDIEKEPAIPVFVQTQLFLILFHEDKGNFDAAEDALYNAIDVLGNHPQLLERGKQFYKQCRKQTDKRLEAGGLPREEVEEGIKEIESRIEAFGGEEKLAQALADLQEQSE